MNNDEFNEETNDQLNNKLNRNYLNTPAHFSPSSIPEALKHKTNTPSIGINNKNNNKTEDKPSLEKKDGLEDKKDNLKDKTDSSKDKKETNEKKKSKLDINSSLFKNDKDDKDSFTGFTKKIKSIKIKLIIFGILAGFLFLFFIISYFMMAYNSLMTSLVTFFGIKETSLDLEDALWTNEKYYVDDNGYEVGLDDYTYPDGTTVEGLKSQLSNACPQNTLSYWFDYHFSENFGENPCRLLNFIWGYSKKEEKDKPGLTVDKSLIIATIFYAYDEQPNYDSYNNPENIEITSASNHYEVLQNILKDDIITKKDVRRIIESTIYNNVYPYLYYDEEKNKCYFGQVENYYTSIKKWELFMRYDQREDNQEYYISGTVSGKNNSYKGSGYEYEQNMNSSWLTSSEECRGHEFFIDRDMYGTKDLSIYNQQVPENEIYTTNTITFQSENRRFSDGYHYVEFDYRNGFVYNKYTNFKNAIESELDYYKYDEMSTPKQIEAIIMNIKERKTDFDEILFTTGSNASNINGSLITPGEVLTVEKYCALSNSNQASQLQVKNTDCQDNFLSIVSFKEYIIGVTLAEIGYKPNNPNYVKAQMVAAISYALGRRDNYQNLDGFQMRSGSCDQNWCDIYQGCSQTSVGGYIYKDGRVLYATVPGVVSSTINKGSCKVGGSYKSGYYKCPMTAEELSIYSNYFDDAVHYVIANSDTGFNGSYVSTIQNSWAAKANSGMDFVQILQEHYGKNGSTVYDCRNF